MMSMSSSRTFNSIVLCALSIALMISSCEAKVFQSTTLLSKNQEWRYISKFGYNIGEGHWQFRARFTRPLQDDGFFTIPLSLHIYLDEQWDDVSTAETCQAKQDFARLKETSFVPMDGSWSNPVSGSLSQYIRPHVWFFSLSDCDRGVFDVHGDLPLQFEFLFLNPNENHFSVEEQGSLSIHLCILLAYVSFLVYHLRHVVSRFKTGLDDSSVHPSVHLVNAAIVMAVLATLCEVLHLWVFKGDGVGVFALDILNQAISTCSQLCLAFLFIFMAWGWTLTQSTIPHSSLFLPSCGVVLFLHVVLIVASNFSEEAPYKFHENEGLPGYGLLILRLVLFAWFAQGVNITYNNEKPGSSRQTFLLTFAVLCSVWFLAFPTVLTVTAIFAPYLRHRVLTIGMFLVQSVALACLSRLFLAKGQFFRVSTFSQSLLPGAKTD
eukprot:GILI01011426.1.p1 GENE.GILI01011426.1~~GILI01011426.1.p1  ORF type:complete len:436 (+),score=112.33 GILI01011426.1:144-1451(+)